MKTAVYFCKCGSNITERIPVARISQSLSGTPDLSYITPVDFLCSEDGKQFLEQDLAEKKPDRVVVAACSPREYENAFRQVLGRAGLNPFFVQMVNIREQVAWVTPDVEQATTKAARLIRGAIARVARHQPLETREIDASPNVLVVGGGPAGLKAALMLAEAGRKVILVEKAPVLGGLPVRYEELFPNMECGPCMLEPVLGEVFHGKFAGNFEVLTLAELTDVAGYFGNFQVKIRQAARYVDETTCIGCGMCIAPCPSTTDNEFNCGLNQRNAIALPFAGAMPNVPFLDAAACVRFRGESCQLCKDACPVEDTIRFDETERLLERNVGAIVVAIGAGLYDCAKLPSLGYGQCEDIYTSLEFERLMASNGPTGGAIVTHSGAAPKSVAIVHCVGSLDAEHKPYCSGVCCDYSFKFNHMLEAKAPVAQVHHFYKELVAPGKEEFALQQHVVHSFQTTLTRYAKIDDLRVSRSDGKNILEYTDVSGCKGSFPADMIVLSPAVVPAADAERLGDLLEVTRDKLGFMEEMHGRLHASQSKVKGIYLAGSCQAPMDIQKAISQGTAAAGYVLSELPEGRKLQVEAITASVDQERCSGCKVCATVCPYKAIAHTPERGRAEINALLCHGCGTCVAACPAGVITGNHFTNDQILAEVKAILQ
jgi:heterodisulfide reductase subunit A